MRYFTLGCCILLASCATSMQNYYNPTVQSWKNGQASDLVKRWGVPDNKIIAPNKTTVYLYKTESYRAQNTVYSPAVGINFTEQGRPVMITQPTTNNAWSRGMTLNCATAFVANPKGIIIDIQTYGNSCYVGHTFAEKMSNPAQPVMLKKR